MPQLAVIGPGAELDLGGKGRLHPAHALTFDRDRWLRDDDRVHHRAERRRAGIAEAGSDTADIDKTVALARRQQQPAEAAERDSGELIADDQERLRLDAFDLEPVATATGALNQAEVLIENWHTLMPAAQPKRSVVKKGAESDEAFTRRVLGKLANHREIVVINDEAHHAYRKPAELKISKKAAADQGIDLDEATRWIEGLDRLHKTRRIQPLASRCRRWAHSPMAAIKENVGNTGKSRTLQQR
jgi:hypothetical protein